MSAAQEKAIKALAEARRKRNDVRVYVNGLLKDAVLGEPATAEQREKLDRAFDMEAESIAAFEKAVVAVITASPTEVLVTPYEPKGDTDAKLDEMLKRAPRFTLVKVEGEHPSLVRTYRVDGGTVAPVWRRGNARPWMEFSVWNDDLKVSSYGGEVWPGAYPDYFTTGPQTRDGKGVFLTPAGADAIRAAIAKADAVRAAKEKHPWTAADQRDADLDYAGIDNTRDE